MMLSVASLAQPTIWAYCSYQLGVTGPITFRANSPEAVTLLADQSNMGRVYASTYFNYKWYGQVTHIGTQTSIDGLFTIDMTDGNLSIKAIIHFVANENATNNTSNSLTLAVNPEGSKYVQISTPGSLVYIYPASFFANESVWKILLSGKT